MNPFPTFNNMYFKITRKKSVMLYSREGSPQEWQTQGGINDRDWTNPQLFDLIHTN